MRVLLFFILILNLWIANGQVTKENEEKDNWLHDLFKTDSVFYNRYIKEGEVEVLYTQINRDNKNDPKFISYHYCHNSLDYFYPASTVKLPVAVFALEKMRADGEVHLWSPMLNDSILKWQTSMLRDSLGHNGYPTLGDHIRKALIYSDNNAFNRLYEYLGPTKINSRLKALGFDKTRIVHRLGIALSFKQNLITNPIYFLNNSLDTVSIQPPMEAAPLATKDIVQKGMGYFENGVLISGPMDFSSKNRFPLIDQQEILKMILFPKILEEGKRFNITSEDYDFLLSQIGTLPRNSGYPSPINKIPDSYSKNFLYDSNTGKIRPNIKIYNKIGLAYGFMIDNSYIIDFENKVEFLLSAVINVNENQIYNDDTYEYDTIGYPFLLHLSELIYDYELNRKRSYLPDLKRFEDLGKN